MSAFLEENWGQGLVLLGGLISFAGALIYSKDTIWGQTRPNRVTFFLWFLAPFVGAVASWVQGVTWAAFPIFMAALAPFVIFCASFINKNAYWKLGSFDWICGALSLLGLVLWQTTDTPNLAIIFAIFGDLTATLPTLKKAWTNPETETPALYACVLVSVLTSFLVLKEFSFAEMAFPLYMVINTSANLTAIFLGKRRKIALGTHILVDKGP